MNKLQEIENQRSMNNFSKINSCVANNLENCSLQQQCVPVSTSYNHFSVISQSAPQLHYNTAPTTNFHTTLATPNYTPLYGHDHSRQIQSQPCGLFLGEDVNSTLCLPSIHHLLASSQQQGNPVTPQPQLAWMQSNFDPQNLQSTKQHLHTKQNLHLPQQTPQTLHLQPQTTPLACHPKKSTTASEDDEEDFDEMTSSDEEEDEKHPSPVFDASGSSAHCKRRQVRYEQLAELFEHTEAKAAKILGISKSKLKRLKNKMNITRWPYRRLQSITKEIYQANQMLKNARNIGDSHDTIVALQQRSKDLEACRKFICSNPNSITKYKNEAILKLVQGTEKVAVHNLLNPCM